MKRRVKNALFFLFFLYFMTSLGAGYIMESWIAGFVIGGVIVVIPAVIAYMFLKTLPKECLKGKSPYVIGDSNGVVYLTQDELEERLKKKH